MDKSVASKDDEWGYQPAKGGMAIEAKLGMFIIMILVGAFGFLVYRRVDMHQQQLLAMNGGEPTSAADQTEVESFESPTQFAATGIETAADVNFEDQFTEPDAGMSDFGEADVTFDADTETVANAMDVDPFTSEVAEQVRDEPNPFDPNVVPDVELADNSQATDDPFAGEFTEPQADNSVAAIDDGLLFEDETSTDVPTVGFDDPEFAALDAEQPQDSFDELELSSPEEEVVLGILETDLDSFGDDAGPGWQSAGTPETEQQFMVSGDEQAAPTDALPGPAEESLELVPAPDTSDNIAFAPGSNPEFPSDSPTLSFDDSPDKNSLPASNDIPDMTIAMLDDTTQGDFGGSLATSPFDVDSRDLRQDEDVAAPPLRMEIPEESPAIIDPSESELSFDLQDAAETEPVLTPVDEPFLPPNTTIVRDDAKFDAQAFAYENRVVPASSESEPCDVCEVQPNDNYWKISKRVYGTSRYFSALALYNSKRIPNPKHLRPGMKVLLPNAEVLEQKYPKLFRDSRTTRKLPTGFFINHDGAAAYRIGEHDTLSQIAQKHLGRSSRWIQIYQLNRGVLANPNKLKPGTVIVLPDDATDVHMVP